MTDILIVIAILTALLLVVRTIAWFAFKATHNVGRWGTRHLGDLHVPTAISRPLESGAERWPGLFSFVRNRFALDRFSGLPLTLFVVLAAFIVFTLAGIVEEVFESTELLAVDEALMAQLGPVRTEAWLAVFAWITALGNQETLTAVMLVATAMLAVHGPRRYILPLWIAVIGAQALSWLGKFVVMRPRPDFLVDLDISTWSFPSGHATSAFSLYLLLAYALTRDLRIGWVRFEIWYWAIALAVLIAISRVIIGVHYPSDIAAGALLGLFWLGVAIAVAEMIKEIRSRRGLSSDGPLLAGETEGPTR